MRERGMEKVRDFKAPRDAYREREKRVKAREKKVEKGPHLPLSQ